MKRQVVFEEVEYIDTIKEFVNEFNWQYRIEGDLHQALKVAIEKKFKVKLTDEEVRTDYRKIRVII